MVFRPFDDRDRHVPGRPPQVYRYYVIDALGWVCPAPQERWLQQAGGKELETLRYPVDRRVGRGLSNILPNQQPLFGVPMAVQFLGMSRPDEDPPLPFEVQIGTNKPASLVVHGYHTETLDEALSLWGSIVWQLWLLDQKTGDIGAVPGAHWSRGFPERGGPERQ